ncbi:helix-turn-helix domain-containing protein [Bacteroides clarus]|uniref:helix-turn-helix domain-containing protein n=1 Tax=Bacteroides clarus TaxID=626929 RepID=UPI003A87EF26
MPMDNRLMTRESEWVAYFIDNTEHIVAKMEQMKRKYRPVLGGEHFLTDKEVAERLKISRRTLQEYRNEGRIAYIQLGGKIIYKESDIERLLKAGYHEAYYTDNF